MEFSNLRDAMDPYALNINMQHYHAAGDVNLVDQIVLELKSKGIFDQFRKECLSDVDTKPAYQNLRLRVEGSVSTFLNRTRWQPDMNKNQLREKLRKHIQESNFLDQGVERIVDQVVNPKVSAVFIPKVEDLVYSFLGIARPERQEKPENKISVTTDNLLPTDLEVVSPGSVKSDQDLFIRTENGDVDSIIEVSDSQDSFVNMKPDEIEDIPLPKAINDSDIPLPAATDPEKIPLPKEETNDMFEPDESSSDTDMLRNVSPLTPIRSFNNENSCDAQQAFDENSLDQNLMKGLHFSAEKHSFKFNIIQPEIMNEYTRANKSSCETKSTDMPSSLTYRFQEQVQVNDSIGKHEDSSCSNNLKIDYMTDYNESQQALEDKIWFPALTSEIPLPKGEPKEKSDLKSKSSRDSKQSSSSRRNDDRSKYKSSSRDREKKGDEENDRRSDKKSSNKSEYRSSSHNKSYGVKELERKSNSSKDKHRTSSNHKDMKSSSYNRHQSSSSHRSSSSHKKPDELKSSVDRKRDSKVQSTSKEPRHRSSHSRSDSKSSLSSNHKNRHESDRKDEKKGKKKPDDHCSLSNRIQRSRRSTDRDSNDGNSSSSKGSQNINDNKSYSQTKNGTKQTQSDTQSSNTESGQSDNVENLENLDVSHEYEIQMEKMEKELEAMMEPEDKTNVEIGANIKLGSEACLRSDEAELYEARKLSKLKKYYENEELRRQQAAAMLIQIQQCSTRPSQIITHLGPEVEFVCMPINEPEPSKTTNDFIGFDEQEQLQAIVEKEIFETNFSSFKSKCKPKLKVINCDEALEKAFKSLTDYDVFKYTKNGHPIKLEKVKKVDPIHREVVLPYKSPECSFMSPTKSEASIESDYATKIEEMVNNTSRQQIMEIILGGEMNHSGTEMCMDYCKIDDEDSSSEIENMKKYSVGDFEHELSHNVDTMDHGISGSDHWANFKRRRESVSDSELDFHVPSKKRKLSLSDQITSTTADFETQHPVSKFLGKARRIGLPKNKRKTQQTPKSPVSDQSVENYEQNIQGHSQTIISPVKLKTVRKPRTEVQRYQTSDLYKPKLHFLSRRHNNVKS